MERGYEKAWHLAGFEPMTSWVVLLCYKYFPYWSWFWLYQVFWYLWMFLIFLNISFIRVAVRVTLSIFQTNHCFDPISLFFIMGGNLSEMIGRTIWKNRPGRDFSVMKVPEWAGLYHVFVGWFGQLTLAICPNTVIVLMTWQVEKSWGQCFEYL